MSGIPYDKLPDMDIEVPATVVVAAAIAATTNIASTLATTIATTKTSTLVTTSAVTDALGSTTSVSKQSNVVGFEDSNWYKIRNVGDNNVVEVDPKSKRLICMPESSDKDDFQKFRAVLQPNGKFRISAKFQKSPTSFLVWDYLLHRQLLVQMKQSSVERFTQQWKSEHVPGYNSLYLIQSGPATTSQKCLKNMGSGQQIKLIDKLDGCVGDHFMHWVLEVQDVPN